MDYLGMFLIGFLLGVFFHALFSYLIFVKEEDIKTWREEQGYKEREYKVKRNPVIINTTSEKVLKQRSIINENQKQGKATPLEDIV